MDNMRRMAAAGMVAALVSVASASSALASDTSIPNLSSPTVTLQVDRFFPEELSVFARGTDNSLLMNRRVNGNWTGVSSLGGGVVGSPTTVSTRGSAFTFVRGIDDNVYFTRVTKGLASGFQVVPGLQVSGRVTAISYLGRITIFARGRDGAGYANTLIFPGDPDNPRSGWTGWQNLGGTLTSDISTSRYGGGFEPDSGDNSIYIFARGTDNAAYVNTSRDPAGGSWTGWRRLGGVLTSNITASVVGITSGSTDDDDPDGEGALLIFARGIDGGLYINRLASNFVWSGWRGVGGVLTSDVGAPEFSFGKVTVFVRATDNTLCANSIDSDGRAEGYVCLGGIVTSNPVAIGNEVYVRGSDTALYVNKQISNGRFTGFTRLGGRLG